MLFLSVVFGYYIGVVLMSYDHVFESDTFLLFCNFRDRIAINTIQQKGSARYFVFIEVTRPAVYCVACSGM